MLIVLTVFGAAAIALLPLAPRLGTRVFWLATPCCRRLPRSPARPPACPSSASPGSPSCS